MEVFYTNSTIRKLFGSAIIGQRCHLAYYGSREPCSWCPAIKTFEDNKTHTAEMSNSEGISWEITSSPVFNGNGFVDSVIEITRDISRRKKTEEALRESEDRYRSLIENINEVIYEIDETGVIRYVSPVIALIGEYNPSELIGRSFLEFVHHEDLPRVKLDFQKVLSGHIESSDFRMLTKSGDVRWFHTSSRPVNLGNDVIGLRGTLTDITGKKHLEAQLLQSQKVETIGRLAGGVAHDFNNVLAAISGNAELAMVKLSSGISVKSYLQEILRASDRGAKLIKQLLAFSRRQILEPKIINLNDVLLDMGKMLHRLIGEDVELVTLMADDLGAVKADPGQIEQVLLNLAVNARDAMRHGGKLTIETANVSLDQDYASRHVSVTPGNYVLVAVSDTGIGMTEEVKAQIFEPFFTTKKAGVGTGLGLATCYGIIKQSRGNIWVYSEPGKGTTFKLYLPTVDQAADVVPVIDESRHLPRGTETVLLVEDEAMVREVATCILRELGYAVLEAADGYEALHIAQEHKGNEIQLLMTDVVMPKISGTALAQKVVAKYPNTKVLFFSGYTDKAIVRHGILDTAVAFLQKPFSSSVLAQKVRQVLDE